MEKGGNGYILFWNRELNGAIEASLSADEDHYLSPIQTVFSEDPRGGYFPTKIKLLALAHPESGTYVRIDNHGELESYQAWRNRENCPDL
ncbi:MAG: hypothetical protein ABIH37_05365 [archaeon]